MIFLMGLPERDAKYRYLAILALCVIVPVVFGLFFWAAASFAWWKALPLGILLIGAGFFLLLRVVDRILPKKLPRQEDRW
jgi:cyanate permease